MNLIELSGRSRPHTKKELIKKTTQGTNYLAEAMYTIMFVRGKLEHKWRGHQNHHKKWKTLGIVGSKTGQFKKQTQ